MIGGREEGKNLPKRDTDLGGGRRKRKVRRKRGRKRKEKEEKESKSITEYEKGRCKQIQV